MRSFYLSSYHQICILENYIMSSWIKEYWNRIWRGGSRPENDEEREQVRAARRYLTGGHAGGAVLSLSIFGAFLRTPSGPPAILSITIILFILGLMIAWLSLGVETRRVRHQADIPNRDLVRNALVKLSRLEKGIEGQGLNDDENEILKEDDAWQKQAIKFENVLARILFISGFFLLVSGILSIYIILYLTFYPLNISS